MKIIHKNCKFEFYLESRNFWNYESFQFSIVDNHCTILPNLFGNYLIYIMKCLVLLREYNQASEDISHI